MGRNGRIGNMSMELGALVLVLALLGCGDRQAPREEQIVIGVIAPVAISVLRSGPPTAEGAALAVKQINAAGGVDLGGHRRKIRLVIEDSEDRPETAVSKAFKLIGSDRAAALVGLPISDNALAVARVAEERRVPLISTAATNPEITLGKSFVFRVTFADPFQGRVLAEFAYRDLAARKAAVLFDPGRAYSRGLAEAFGASFERLGGQVVVEEGYTADESDVTDRLHRIRQSGADVLLAPLYQSLLSPLMRQARAMGITVPALGGDTWNNLPATECAGWSPAYYSDVWTTEALEPASRRFIEAYLEEYAKPATTYAALAYDGVFLVARAIEARGDATPESIRAGLLSLRGFAGVTGAIRFENGGDPLRSAVIMRLADDGSAYLHQVLEPEAPAR